MSGPFRLVNVQNLLVFFYIFFYLKTSITCLVYLFIYLQHYSELPDIKRVIVNTHAIEPQSLVEFFGTLSREWALECMKDLLLVNLRGNLQIIVQVTMDLIFLC